MSSSSALDILTRAAVGGTVAIRSITKLQPVGGPNDKVSPPTYEGGKYAFEIRRKDDKEIQTVLLDSVQSQANRFEEVLLQAHKSKRLALPVFEVKVPNHEPVTSLTAPHRIHDAILRDSLWNGTPFRESDEGKRLVAARSWNATPFFEYAPTALLFGTWDSQSGAGVNSAKIARSLVSEIIGLNAVNGRRTSSRLDPLGIKAVRDVIVKSDKQGEIWKFQPAPAEAKKAKKTDTPKFLRPSEVNHGNVTPTITGDDGPGGVTFTEAVQTVVLSFTQMRRLHFPNADGTESTERDAAARAVLAALALCAVSLAWEEGFQLRSRCQLIPVESPKFEVLGRTVADTDKEVKLDLDANSAIELLKRTLQAAEKQGLKWKEGTIDLQPRPDLVQLVEFSDRATELPEAADTTEEK